MNDPELVKNFAMICAADAFGILPDELTSKNECRKVAHARYVCMALMHKFSKLTQEQIVGSLNCCVDRTIVSKGIKMVSSEIDLFNRKGVISDIVKKYKVSEDLMKKEFKPRYWTKVPEVK